MSNWLDGIEVASPCHESWDGMRGSERERHCDRCEQTVYDLSGMTRDEAEALVLKTTQGERVCIRFRRRADGTVLTADCPTQVRQARTRWSHVRAAAAGFLALAGGFAASGCTDQASATPPPPPPPGTGGLVSGGAQPTTTPCCPDGQGPCCSPDGRMEMGEVMVEPPAMMGAPLPPPEMREQARQPEEPEEARPVKMGKMVAPPPRESSGGKRLPLAGEEE